MRENKTAESYDRGQPRISGLATLCRGLHGIRRWSPGLQLAVTAMQVLAKPQTNTALSTKGRIREAARDERQAHPGSSMARWQRGT